MARVSALIFSVDCSRKSIFMSKSFLKAQKAGWFDYRVGAVISKIDIPQETPQSRGFIELNSDWLSRYFCAIYQAKVTPPRAPTFPVSRPNPAPAEIVMLSFTRPANEVLSAEPLL